MKNQTIIALLEARIESLALKVASLEVQLVPKAITKEQVHHFIRTHEKVDIDKLSTHFRITGNTIRRYIGTVAPHLVGRYITVL